MSTSRPRHPRIIAIDTAFGCKAPRPGRGSVRRWPRALSDSSSRISNQENIWFASISRSPRLLARNIGCRTSNSKVDIVVHDFDVADEAGGVMRGTVKEFSSIEVKNDLTLELSAANGKTIISGIELIRQD